MHLQQTFAFRADPFEGAFLALTRRCPLRCGHCSTGSEPSSQEHYDGGIFTRFVGTIRPETAPKLLVLTGGEPLVRPRLCFAVTSLAHDRGIAVAIATGGFFARTSEIAPDVLQAIQAADSLTVSLDSFHEEQVRREDVFRCVDALLDSGVQVDFQVTGRDEDDPYLAAVTAEVRSRWADRVAMLVAFVNPVGRARDFALRGRAKSATSIAAYDPCRRASWPVVRYDGTVLACCNQDVVDSDPAPEHLVLGHAATDSWDTVRERGLDRDALRVIRTLGPTAAAAETGARPLESMCRTCRGPLDARLREGAELSAVTGTPGFEVLERAVRAIQRQAPWTATEFEPLRALGATTAPAVT